MISELIKKSRSYRRFYADRAVDTETLVSIIDEARACPSAANMQRLRFALVNDEAGKDTVFTSLRFAGYLKEWGGPTPEERPAAYIVVCADAELNTNLSIDLGIFAQTILLSATARGLGGCMFRAFDAARISEVVGVSGMIPHLVIALGVPSERVELVPVVDGDIKYYRDSEETHFVPKYSAEELIIKK